MGFIKTIKRKLKRNFILKGKRLARFGLSGTILYSDGSDLFDDCEFECSGQGNSVDLKGGCNLHNSKFYVSGSNNRIVINRQADLKDVTFYISGSDNLITIGQYASGCESKVVFNKTSFFIKGNNNGVTVKNNCYIGGDTFWLEGNENAVNIGVGLHSNGKNNYTLMEGAKFNVGDDCLFSTDIVFQVADGHPIYDLSGNRINVTENVSIGNHVWVGKKVTVLKGANIPDGSVVGTCAVVLEKFDENNVVLVGSPAKVVRHNIRWEK